MSLNSSFGGVSVSKVRLRALITLVVAILYLRLALVSIYPILSILGSLKSNFNLHSILDLLVISFECELILIAVSYTHLTLPTKRIV